MAYGYMNSLLLSTLANMVIKQTILFQLYDYKCSVNKLFIKMSTGFEEYVLTSCGVNLILWLYYRDTLALKDHLDPKATE